MFTKTTIKKTGHLIEVTEYSNPIEYGYDNKETSIVSEKKDLDPAIQEYNKMKNRYRATSRAKNEIVHLFYGNMYHDTSERMKFMTLTFRENETDRRKANGEFTKFIKRLERHPKVKRKLRYICVPEKQIRGAYHYHIIFFNLPYFPQKLIASVWKNGDISDIQKINRTLGAVNYVSKYLKKSFFDENDKNSRRYFYSVVIKPNIIRREDKAQVVAHSLKEKNTIQYGTYTHKVFKGDKVVQVITKRTYLLKPTSKSNVITN